MLRSRSKSSFSSDCPEFTNETLPNVWNFTLSKDSLSCISFSAQKPLSTALFMKALTRVPLAQVLTVSRNTLITSWLQTASRNKAFVTISILQRRNLGLQEPGEILKAIQTSGRAVKSLVPPFTPHKSPFGVTFTDMQAHIRRMCILQHIVSTDTYPKTAIKIISSLTENNK